MDSEQDRIDRMAYAENAAAEPWNDAEGQRRIAAASHRVPNHAEALAMLRAVHAALYVDGPDTSWSPDTLDAVAEAIGGYDGLLR